MTLMMYINYVPSFMLLSKSAQNKPFLVLRSSTTRAVTRNSSGCNRVRAHFLQVKHSYDISPADVKDYDNIIS